MVRIERVRELLSDPAVAGRVFSSDEFVENIASMAGKFAAKEAIFKARGTRSDWLDFKILKRASGEPYVATAMPIDIKISISHEGEYAIAIALIETV